MTKKEGMTAWRIMPQSEINLLEIDGNLDAGSSNNDDEKPKSLDRIRREDLTADRCQKSQNPYRDRNWQRWMPDQEETRDIVWRLAWKLCLD
jgi:hypothetical protein